MSDHYEVIYSLDAQRDLENIYNYIKFSLLDSFAATRQFNHLRTAARSLSTFPARYARVEWPRWSAYNIRKVAVDNYVILYRIDEHLATVFIVRIFYGGSGEVAK